MCVIGADSETCDGPPFTFQFYSEDVPINRIIPVNPKKALSTLIAFFETLPRLNKKPTYTIYIHNLQFDLVSFFWDRKFKELLEDEFNFSYKGWQIRGWYDKPAFVVATRMSGCRITVRMIDTYNFYQGTLEKLAEIHCPHFPKLKMPSLLGQIKYPLTNKRFVAYAMRDAKICYHAGRSIQRLHKEWDVEQSISAPGFASRVFRREFVKATMPLPSRSIIYPSLHSYHGGKNNITCEAGFHKRVYCLDITSAYPFAMAGLPSFSDTTLLKQCTGDASISKVPPEGIYRIWGKTKDCPWPIIYTHSFKPIRGRVEGIWTTGYELNEAFRAREINLEKMQGFYYESWNDHTLSPFPAFVKEFFRLKDTAKFAVDRAFYKLILVSLYGKFIEKRQASKVTHKDLYDIDDQSIIEINKVVSGGLFNPFIATLITGHTRAYVHRLEHKYKALHAATDSVFTRIKPTETPGLGGLQIEAYGTLMIMRNKLYIFYSKKKGKNGIRSRVFPNQYIIKCARHGFRGSISTLEGLAVTGRRSYYYIKVNKLRESYRQKLVPNRFQGNTAQLNLEKKAK